MKLKKILAGVAASALAVGSLAAAVSANSLWTIPEGTEYDEGLILNKDMYLVQLFNVGNEKENKPARDYGINPHDVAKFKFYSQVLVAEGEDLTLNDIILGEDGAFGGGVIFSANGGDFGKNALDSPIYDEETGLNYWNKYNWPNTLTWWGLPGENDTPEGAGVSNEGPVTWEGNHTVWEYMFPFHYQLECEIPDDLRWPEDKMAGCYQIGMQEWSEQTLGCYDLKIDLMVVYDDNDKPLIAFDSLGYPLQEEDKINEEIARLTNPDNFELPSEPEPSGDSTEASGDSTGANEPSGDSTASTTSNAPTTTAASNSNNDGSIGLIIAIIAVVVVVVVVVVIIVIKKKKS